jgi:tetratricopeptide (TPR) repeat protein
MGQIPNTDSGPANDEAMAVRLFNEMEYAKAIPYLKHAHSNSPRNADIMMLLGIANGEVGDYPESLKWYQKAIEENPDHKMAHEDLGILYLKMKDLVSAQGQLAELVRICPDSCDERQGLARAVASYQSSQTAAAPSPAASPH